MPKPTSESFGGSRFSPDGRWIACTSDESAGRELIYVAPDGRMMSVDVAPGPKLSVGVAHSLFTVSAPKAVGNFSLYDVAPDEQRFLVRFPSFTEPRLP